MPYSLLRLFSLNIILCGYLYASCAVTHKVRLRVRGALNLKKKLTIPFEKQPMSQGNLPKISEMKIIHSRSKEIVIGRCANVMCKRLESSLAKFLDGYNL